MAAKFEDGGGGAVWDNVMEVTKVAQEKGSDPLLWAVQLSASLNSAGVSLPSVELAHVLVSFICWDNNVPIVWKFVEKAITLRIVPPLLLLALLSTRVIPNRRLQPAAYRLYMELLKRHTFQLKCQIHGPDYQKVMKAIDAVLHLSEMFGLPSEPGALVVGYIFSVLLQLLDASLDDERLLELTPERKSRWPTKPLEMEIDGHDGYDEERTEYHERMRNMNTVMAIEIIGQILQNKVTSRIVYLAHRNLYVFCYLELLFLKSHASTPAL